MSDVVLYDSGDATVANRVTGYHKSVHTPDYTGEVLVNPDLSALSSVPWEHWKESSGAVIEMSQAEKDLVDALPPAGTIREEKYYVAAYSSHLMSTETWYYTDNGDGTYSDKVREITYSYTGSKLDSRVEKVYFADGTEESSETYNYFENDQGDIIEKKV